MRTLGLASTYLLAVPLVACGSSGGDNDDSTSNTSITSPMTLTNNGDTGTGAAPTTGEEPTAGATEIGDSRGTEGMDDTGATGPGATTGAPACLEADCAPGEHCDGDACVPGCNEDADCPEGVCDVDYTCKDCLVDMDCDLGNVCSGGACVPGCSDSQPCTDGLSCCGGACVDQLADPEHCGSCDACPGLPNAASTCAAGVCGLGACSGAFNNCDGDAGNGCEVDGACDCTPNEVVPCYSGPDGTMGVGVCKAGTQTCNAQGTGFSACEGEVLPAAEDVCGNAMDDDCNNQVDEDADQDADGYSRCGGDCCDAVSNVCSTPNLVNPGAFEVGGNMVDDDCDGAIDNPLAACDGGLASNSATATDYAKAIDLCQTTSENAMGPDKKWGVISGAFNRANGGGNPDASARSIRTGFGTVITPQQNSSLAILSTGNAADLSDNSPGYADFQSGKDNGANSAAPTDWLAANGNQFPNAPGCPVAGSNQAFNSIQLKLRVRVPTNALSFSVQMYFFSAEWPEYVCTQFNDLFVTLIDSTGVGNPGDKNLAIYTTPQNQKYPVGVNIAKAASGLFTQCKNGAFACLGNGGNYNGCVGTGQLAGTGFDILEGGCGNNNTTGGGTGWLKMSGNVKPGEVMEVRFVIWDTGDGIYDSLVLLDDWEWSVQASEPGVSPN